MGCFPGCFGRRKNRQRQRRRESFQPRLNRISEDNLLNLRSPPTFKEVPKVSHWSGKDDRFRVPTVKEVPKNSDGSGKDDRFRVPTVKEVPKISDGSAKDGHLNFMVPIAEEVPKNCVLPINDICDKAKENYSPSPTRKKVTFDSNVKTYEHIAVHESIELFEEKKDEVRPEENKSRQGQCLSEGSDVTSNSSGIYPSNHRYQNCRESDDEEEDAIDCGQSDLEDSDDDDDGELLHEDYYDDVNYEDKLQNWDKEVYTEEIADNVLDIDRTEEKTRGSNAIASRDRSGYVNAVLNPIENLTQWKAVKSKGRITQTRKENANLITDQEQKLNASFSLEPKSRDETKKQRTQEVAVDASLSTWLTTTTTSGCSNISVGDETATSEKKKYTSSYSKSVQSHDERPILCALTAEDIKQFSAKSSPRKSPSRSSESPIIGTVGGYWNSQSIATRKYREV